MLNQIAFKAKRANLEQQFDEIKAPFLKLANVIIKQQANSHDFHALWKPKQSLYDMIPESEQKKSELVTLRYLPIPVMRFITMVGAKMSELNFIFIKLSMSKLDNVSA